MNNIYENNYSEIIEILYGEKRDNIYDKNLIKNNILPHEFTITERSDFTQYDTYSIDPKGCEDADDAFSIYTKNNKLFLAIHIADPTEYININSTLWNDIKTRMVTRYPSNRKPIHMIPYYIIELSSLIENQYSDIRNAITILTEIDNNTYNPIGIIQLLFSKIKVQKEHALSYESASNNINNVISIGLNISNALQKYRGSKTIGIKLNEISNSYLKYNKDQICLYKDEPNEIYIKQMIAEFAIFANSFIGEYLKIHLNGIGIFRTCEASEWLKGKDNISGKDLLNEIITNGIKAEYMSNITSHDLVGMPEYCHFTSPIRRLTDCICHYLLKYIHLKNKNININIPFTNNELDEYSNKCLSITKNIKKIQYKDIKFRLIQGMNNLLLKSNYLILNYFITGYTGLFLNLIINKINEHNVYMSYSLRIPNYKYKHDPKKIHTISINKVNCFKKFDNGTIPQLDEHIKLNL